jgi:hypothetical protein
VSIRNARFEITTGAEFAATVTPAGVTGGGAKLSTFVQPDWYAAATTNVVTKVGYATGTLSAAATADIDLTALTGPDGSTVNLARVTCGYIQITSTTSTGKLRIGNAASNAHQLDFGADTHTWTIRANGPGLAFGDPTGTGSTVDGTNKNVKVENTGSGSVDYVAYFGGQ